MNRSRQHEALRQGFREVPMTHLAPRILQGTSPVHRGPHSFAPETPVSGAPEDFGSSTYAESVVRPFLTDKLLDGDEDDETLIHVRKWQHFGLQVTPQISLTLSGPQRSPPQRSLCEKGAGLESPTSHQSVCQEKACPHRGTPVRKVNENGDLLRYQLSRMEKEPVKTAGLHHHPVSVSFPASTITTEPAKLGLSVKEVENQHDNRAAVQETYGEDAAKCANSKPVRHQQYCYNKATPALVTTQPRVPSQHPEAAPIEVIGTDDGQESADGARHLHVELAKLSQKVQLSAEVLRCGPPKRSGGSFSSWPPKRQSARERGACTARKVKYDERNGNDGSVKGAVDALACERSTISRNQGTKSSRKRDRTASGVAGGDRSTSTAPQNKRKMGAANQQDPAGCATGAAAPRTLFSISSNGKGNEAIVGNHSAPAASASVSVPYIYLQTSTDNLFSDIRRALHDPDRIQAPPLFVGLSALSVNGRNLNSATAALANVECRTNFTYPGNGSRTAKSRASRCFTSLDPLLVHQQVELIILRWKDEIYALPAQTLGLAFLCRVLAELPGVELITFNAQVLLIALLAHRKGTLWSHCVSDVRVMAWMAQVHVSGSPSMIHQTVHTSAGGSSADGIADVDMSLLYHYEQLLGQVCGGKVLPTIQLKKTSEMDQCSSATELTTAASPPTTPAQRQLAQEVYYLATVYRSLYGLLGSKGLLQPFLRQEKRIAHLLALMKYNGMYVDLHELHRFQRSCEAEMARQRCLANSLVPGMGEDFNIQSHDQCRKALYEVLELGKYLLKAPSGEVANAAGLTITKGGRLSTAEDTLRALAQHHEFPRCLLRYRKASKLMQTYVEGMMAYAVVRKSGIDEAQVHQSPGDALQQTSTSLPTREGAMGAGDDNPFIDCWLPASSDDSNSTASLREHLKAQNGEEAVSSSLSGRVASLPSEGYATLHPNFLQEGTDTGRLSCMEPNLQNLPRNSSDATDEEGEEYLLSFRRCFVAVEGCVLLSVDYQQIELRVLAHLCGDASLVEALSASADIHRSLAEVIFKKQTVTAEERNLAKRVVFGVLYGAGPKTLAAQMEVSVERALQITSLLTSAFPGIDNYHRRVIEESRINGFVRTLSGRLRYLPEIRSTVLTKRSYAERQAFNSVVQGSAADVMKMAMLAVSREVLQRYESTEVCLLSQIHDEMVFMVRKELLPAVVPLISSAMTHATQLCVPLSVTVKFGTSLGNLREWSVEDDLGLGEDV